MILEQLKALADPCRLRLIGILLHGEFTVQELTFALNMGQSRISRHLKILTEAHILSVKRQGTWSYYSAAGDSRFFSAIREELTREIAALPEYPADLSAITAILEQRHRRSREFFNQHANQWDELARNLLPVPEYQDRLLEQIPSGKTVVEVGLGTGGLIPALAAKSASLIGVDHSPAMLEIAAKRVAQAENRHVELRLGDMTHLPLPDNSADCAVLNMVLHHAANPRAVLDEIRRVLVDGGILCLADLARHEQEWVRDRLADQWLGFEETELHGWLKSAGFSLIHTEKINGVMNQESILIIRAM